MAQEEKLKEAKRLYETANADQRYVLESLFPELAESEDERIRKALIKFFTLSDDNADYQCCGVHYKDIVAWLERQEYKPAEWSKKHLWKDAQGDDLPEIDREVIALLDNGKVVYAHRPYKGKYIGKSLTTGNIETFENQTYDEGGWNQPNVKWWLDIEKLPNMEE